MRAPATHAMSLLFLFAAILVTVRLERVALRGGRLLLLLLPCAAGAPAGDTLRAPVGSPKLYSSIAERDKVGVEHRVGTVHSWLQPFLSTVVPIIFICLGNTLNGAYSLTNAFSFGQSYMGDDEALDEQQNALLSNRRQ